MTFRAERFHWGDDSELDFHPPKTPRAKFDPSEPRDEQGRWTDGGGASGGAIASGGGPKVVAFHGTIENVVARIKGEGLHVTQQSHHFDGDVYAGERGESVFVTTNAKTAIKYASTYAQAESGKEYKSIAPVVFKLEVPEDEWRKFNEDRLEPESYYTKTIPPEWIEGVYKIGDEDKLERIKAAAGMAVAYLVIFVGEPKEDATKDWDEGKHPRVPAGSPEGGQFGHGGGGAPSGPAPKLPGVADVPPYAGRREDVHPDDGKKIYDNRVDPQYLTKSKKLEDVTEVTSGLNKRGNYYQRHWGRRDDKGDLIIIEVNRKGAISSPDWFKLENDPFEETVKLDREAEPEAPHLTDEDYENMKLVSFNPPPGRVKEWIAQVEAKSKELDAQGKNATPEDFDNSRMLTALNAYMTAPAVDIVDGRDALFTVHNGNNVLKSVTHLRTGTKETTTEGASWKSTYAGLISGGTEHDAIVKNLRQAILAYGNRVDTLEISTTKDRPDLIKAYEDAGFRQTGTVYANKPNLVEMIYGKDTSKGPAVDLSILEHLPLPLERHEGTGPEFAVGLARGFQAIPPKAMATMAKEGIRFNVGTHVTALDPELKGEHPRGWPAGYTWDSVEALFRPSTNTVYIAETYRPANQTKYVPSRRVAGSVVHEGGHAFDKALGNPSYGSKQFREAYEHDVENIPKERRPKLRYFLQRKRGSSAAGRSETFAELFASHASPGANGKDIRPDFPSTSRLVKQAMDSGVWLEGVLL